VRARSASGEFSFFHPRENFIREKGREGGREGGRGEAAAAGREGRGNRAGVDRVVRVIRILAKFYARASADADSSEFFAWPEFIALIAIE
jgi:hypothetical protein